MCKCECVCTRALYHDIKMYILTPHMRELPGPPTDSVATHVNHVQKIKIVWDSVTRWWRISKALASDRQNGLTSSPCKRLASRLAANRAHASLRFLFNWLETLSWSVLTTSAGGSSPSALYAASKVLDLWLSETVVCLCACARILKLNRTHIDYRLWWDNDRFSFFSSGLGLEVNILFRNPFAVVHGEESERNSLFK